MIMEHDFGPSLVTLREDDIAHPDKPVQVSDIKQRYQQFNAKYFNNRLPEVLINFAALPGEVGAMTHYQATKQGNQGHVDPRSIRIDINNMFKSPRVHYGTKGSVWSILLHEMTHILMGVSGLVDEHHGSRFKSELQRLSPLTGYSYDDLMGKIQARESEVISRMRTLAGIG